MWCQNPELSQDEKLTTELREYVLDQDCWLWNHGCRGVSFNWLLHFRSYLGNVLSAPLKILGLREIITYLYNLSTQENEAEGLRVWGYPGLHIKMKKLDSVRNRVKVGPWTSGPPQELLNTQSWTGRVLDWESRPWKMTCGHQECVESSQNTERATVLRHFRRQTVCSLGGLYLPGCVCGEEWDLRGKLLPPQAAALSDSPGCFTCPSMKSAHAWGEQKVCPLHMGDKCLVSLSLT